jgi:hypothetical protein
MPVELVVQAPKTNAAAIAIVARTQVDLRLR